MTSPCIKRRCWLGRTTVVALLGAAVIGTGGPAAAGPLTAATFTEYASGIGTHDTGADDALPETASVSVNTGRGTVAASVTTDGTLPQIGIAGTVEIHGKDSPASFGGDFSGNIDFQFMVEALGPSPATVVPVDIVTAGGVLFDYMLGNVGSSSFTASSQLDIPSVGRWTASRSCDNSGCSSDPESFALTHTSDLQVGNIYSAAMFATSHGQGGGLPLLFDSTAFVNVAIAINPSFGDASQYRVVFSPGITTATIPLPPTLPLMFAGLAGLGLVRRGLRGRDAA